MYYIIVLIILHLATLQCNEIKKKIYDEIPNPSVSHCVRRLNSTTSVGCTSKPNGNVGIVEIAFNESTINDNLNRLKDDTILVINTKMFINTSIVNNIVKNVHITGLIVFDRNCNNSDCQTIISQSFSEDYTIPNEQFSVSINHTFNPDGTAYGFKVWPFPVALIGRRYMTEQDKIIKCFNTFNVNSSSNRKCALEIRNFMASTRSVYDCQKNQKIYNSFAGLFHPFAFCEDFSGVNYIVPSIAKVKNRQPNSVIVLISRMDSLSMFEKSAADNHGALTSVALLLSVMHLLTSQPEFKTSDNLKKDVLFLFLDNESYDYLGSNRFLQDLEHGNIANSSGSIIKYSHLDLLLEFGELGFVNFSKISFFSHPYQKEVNGSKVPVDYTENLWKQFENYGFDNRFSTSGSLPPSSVQYLLRNLSKPVVVITDHEYRFKNRYYNSYLGYQKLTNNSVELVAIVNAVASFVFTEVTEKNLTNILSISDEVTPDKIIDCFSENIQCPLLRKVLEQSIINNLNSIGTPIPTQAHSTSKEISSDYRLSYLLNNLIVYLSGQRTNISDCLACPKCANLSLIKSGKDTKTCYLTRIETYDEFSLMKKNTSLWATSSIVEGQSIRLFVMADNTRLLIVGIVLTVLATILMTLLSSRMPEIFPPDGSL